MKQMTTRRLAALGLAAAMGLTLAGEGISFTAKEDGYRFLPLKPAQP